MEIIARIYNDYGSKFGIPRQPGLVDGEESVITFEPEYSVPEAFRGIEEYSHIWVLWEFSENKDIKWSPTVRPPKLGGNIRKGVFATRSPYRPNPIGLSCLELKSAEFENGRMMLKVSGADMLNGTPIYDIKPYIPYSDSVPGASSGFSVNGNENENRLEVIINEDIAENFPAEKLSTLKSVLSLDPRPGYAEDDNKTYGFTFASFEVKFIVRDNVLTVTDIIKE